MHKTLIMPTIMSAMAAFGLAYQLSPSAFMTIAHGLHLIADTCFCAAA